MQLSYSHGVSSRPLIGKNVKIEGRLKDMICRGGEKIFPREVEEFLFTHPKIAEAYVIGVPDSYYGEQVMAWVKCKEGQTLNEDEVRSFCRGQTMDCKIPHYVKIRHRLSNRCDRENPEVPHARNQRGRTGRRTREPGEGSIAAAGPSP